jgi:hypothetical protein
MLERIYKIDFKKIARNLNCMEGQIASIHWERVKLIVSSELKMEGLTRLTKDQMLIYQYPMLIITILLNTVGLYKVELCLPKLKRTMDQRK